MAARLHLAMLKKGMNGRELAAKAKVPYMAVAELHCARRPSWRHIAAMCAALDVTVEWMIGGE